ncbi:hypothetical protein ACVW00_003449 [Marmoricola sp. URHA0025 HA25]
MDDPQRKPGDRDRSALVARIRRAADQGRIATADRDIRLSNVASAQSMAELDLIARDLDQLEAAPAPVVAGPPAGGTTPTAPAAPASWAGADPEAVADKVTDQAKTFAKGTLRSVGVIVVLVVVGLGLGASALLGARGSDAPPTRELFTPEPIPTDGVTDEPVGGPTATPGGTGSAYALTAVGIGWFLDEYRTRQSTTKVVDLTLYDDYVVVQVPQPGTNRHAGMLYRPAGGWTDFGGISANFPGSRPVDLDQLDVPALVHNIARARRTLGVESVSQTYVVIDYRPQFDPAPNVDIHVANAFGESGYLATTLDGSLERAFPYEP